MEQPGRGFVRNAETVRPLAAWQGTPKISDCRHYTGTVLEIGTRTDLRATDDGSDWLEAADLCRRVARGTNAPQLSAELLAIAEKFEVEAQLRAVSGRIAKSNARQ